MSFLLVFLNDLDLKAAAMILGMKCTILVSNGNGGGYTCM